MTKGTTRPLEIPKEMQTVAEQGVEQAKLAFNNYMQAAQEAGAAKLAAIPAGASPADRGVQWLS